MAQKSSGRIASAARAPAKRATSSSIRSRWIRDEVLPELVVDLVEVLLELRSAAWGNTPSCSQPQFGHVREISQRSPQRGS